MHFAFVLSLLSSPIVIHAVSLGDALRYQAGASNFAQTIESNAEISALVRSGPLTIFAPVDINSSLTYLRRRDTKVDTNNLDLQLCDGITKLTGYRNVPRMARELSDDYLDTLALRTVPGKVIETKDKSGNLNGNPQAVVAHIALPNSPVRRSIGNLTGETITISSGLGNNVSIIRGDIPFDSGIIYVVEDYFTKPISLSATSNQTGNTQFASRLGRSNLTYLLDNTPSITAFIPSNVAFAALGNYTQTSAQIASQLSNHIVTNQVLYLPRLVNGACYRTNSGNEITVTVKGSRYFINDAEISQPDLILENGVAHIINKVITPTATTTPQPTPFTQSFPGSGCKITLFNPSVVLIITIATAFLVHTLS